MILQLTEQWNTLLLKSQQWDIWDLNWQNLEHMVCLLSCMLEERRKTVHMFWRMVWVLWWRETPACHYDMYVRIFSTCSIMWTATRNARNVWHHAVLSNRFWILSEGSSETQRTHIGCWEHERHSSHSRLQGEVNNSAVQSLVGIGSVFSFLNQSSKTTRSSFLYRTYATTKSTFCTVDLYDWLPITYM